MEQHLIAIASEFLEPFGRSFRLTADVDSPGREILNWRWMSLALPTDLLVAGRVPDPRCSACEVEVLDPSLRVLEPTAHLHVHASAALTFAQIWAVISEELNFTDVVTAPAGFDVPEWKACLRRAVAARWVLDLWMHRGQRHAIDYMRRNPHVMSAMVDLRRGVCRADDPAREASIEGFVRNCESLRRARRTAQRRGSSNTTVGEGLCPDDEIKFVRQCLAYLRRESDDTFRTLWVQRTRIRVLLFRHLVHDPAERGLDSFAARFRRIDEYATDGLEERRSSVPTNERGLSIERVEFRGGTWVLTRLIEESHRGRRRVQRRKEASQPAEGWILHFIRDKGKDAQSIIRRHYQTAAAIAARLTNRPELLKCLWGLDVASRELSGPLWYAALPIRQVLSLSRRIAGNREGLQGLHLTVHAGEEFRHLLGGLRAVHEPFWWDLMRRGDRIGHALAIGLDPKRWCEEHPVVVMPRNERMLDLAWMLKFVATRKIGGIRAAVLAAAQDELDRHLREWRVKDATVPHFLELADKLGRPEIWLQINAPHWKQDSFIGTAVLRLFWRLLRARDDTSASEMVEVRTEGEAEDLTLIRDELARLLARWRTPIEVNPSSNLLIGGFKHVLDQPLFHIDPFDPDDARGLVLTLSTDDPLCFATTLSDEFAYAWAGMTVAAGKSPAYAQEWLERAARNARRAAFRP